MSEKNYEGLKLRNQLCFPLYAAARETIKLYTPFLDEIGLTYTQYIAMMVLREHHSVTVKEMGEQLLREGIDYEIVNVGNAPIRDCLGCGK